MAKLLKISNTSWEQPFRDRKKELHLWNSHNDVADHCNLKDGTKRLLRIKFESRFQIDVIDQFQITSGREISFPRELRELIRPIVFENPSSYFVVRVLDMDDEEDTADIDEFNTDGTSTIKTRIGQQKFRDALIDYWKGCALSGIQLREILKASHIKPWKDATHEERLDPYNGILLSPTYDALFDRGFISFDDDGNILLSKLAKKLAPELHLSKEMKLRKLDERHKKYLRIHRELLDSDR